MSRRIISALIVFLLLASVAIPAASATEYTPTITCAKERKPPMVYYECLLCMNEKPRRGNMTTNHDASYTYAVYPDKYHSLINLFMFFTI